MARPNDNLPISARRLSDGAASTELFWCVVRTNPKCEDRAQASVSAEGFATYLPKLKRERRHPRSKVWQVKEYPLFSRYMFVGIESVGQIGIVRSCDGVEAPLGINGHPLRVPGADVARFRFSQAAGDFDDMRRSSVKRPHRTGDIVRITQGCLTGVYGHVATYRGRQTVELMVSLFGGLTPVLVSVDGTEAT